MIGLLRYRPSFNTKHRGFKMNVPSKEKMKTSAVGAVVGAIIVMIIGFSWGGWVLGSTAMESAEKMAQTAVTERLAPICAEQFQQDPERDAKYQKMEDKYDWEKEEYIQEQGWATMPFEDGPDRYVAQRCLELIAQIKQ